VSTLYILVSEKLLIASSNFSDGNIRAILEEYNSAQISVTIWVFITIIYICTNLFRFLMFIKLCQAY